MGIRLFNIAPISARCWKSGSLVIPGEMRNLLFNRNGSLDKQIPRAAEQRRSSE